MRLSSQQPLKSSGAPKRVKPLYTAAQRRRRDASVWTTVQGVLAPLQFLVFLVSLALVVRTLTTGDGYAAAAASVVVKTAILYLIMVTGSVWEKVVFDKWLFADAFFWEDVVSFGVLALHTLYLWALAAQWSVEAQLGVALAAYAAYLVNAAQFLWKLRQARLQAPDAGPPSAPTARGASSMEASA